MYLLYPKNSTWRWLRAISTQRSEKCPYLFTDWATSELSMRAWSWNVTDSKTTISALIIPRYIQIWQSKEMSHDFVRGQSVAELGLSDRQSEDSVLSLHLASSHGWGIKYSSKLSALLLYLSHRFANLLTGRRASCICTWLYLVSLLYV